MQSRVALLMMMVVLALAPAGFAAGKKSDKASVTFHMETEGTDNPKMIFSQLTNGKTRYFRRMAEFSLKDIASYSPFASAAGGDDYGIVFTLKDHSAGRLTVITNANQGRWMITQVNGRVVDGVFINSQVNDGKLVVWKGITLADLSILDKALPRTGEDDRKK